MLLDDMSIIFLHKTCHFNLTVHSQTWSLQLTLKITWSLAKIKVAIVKNKAMIQSDGFNFKISRLNHPFHFTCFNFLSFWTHIQIVQIEKIST